MPNKTLAQQLLEWILEAEDMDEPTFAEWQAEQSQKPKAD